MKPSEHRCWKCAHLTMCGEFAVCNYFENTGKLRTWPEGPNGPWVRNSPTEPCPCYKRAEKGKGLNAVPPLPKGWKEKQKPKAEKKTDTRKGPKCSWDYEKARRMYLDGEPLDKIVAETGAKKRALTQYSIRYGWRLDPECVQRDRRKIK